MKSDNLIIGAVLAGGAYLAYKWKKPLETVEEATNKVIDTTGNLIDYGAGGIVDIFGGESKNTYKTAVQNSARSAVSATTTLYDNVKNRGQILFDQGLNLFRDDKQTTVDRYRTSSSNQQFVGNVQVRSTVITDKDENIVGSYDNELKQTLTAPKAQLIENNVKNPIVQIAKTTSSSSRKSSSSSSRKSSSSSSRKSSSSSKKISISKSTKPVVKKYENKTKQSTTLSSKKIKAYSYLTGN